MTHDAPKPHHIVVGVADAQDEPTILHAFHLAKGLAPAHVHLVHVLTEAEAAKGEGEARLERYDDRIVEDRNRLWSLAERIGGVSHPSFRVHVDVRLGRFVHRELMAAADDCAATLLVVGAAPEESESLERVPEPDLPEQLVRFAPCSVVVVRPNATRSVPSPLLEPAPAPGEPMREQNAISSTHVVKPSPDRRGRESFAHTVGGPSS